MHENYSNLPNHFIPLDAFNLIPGATFVTFDSPDPRVWVVEKIIREDDFEQVHVWAHDASNASSGGGLASENAFRYPYNHQVALVGLVVNPEDADDNNWGA